MTKGVQSFLQSNLEVVMKHISSRRFLAAFLALALAIAPFSQAEARWRGHHHHHHGNGWGTAAIVSGALLGTALLVNATQPRYYAPAPAYYYPQQQAYYAPQPVYYSAPQPRYYVQSPNGAYYAPAAAYYPY